MLQSADISFGIQGASSNSAAAASDYAISQFQDLRRLIFWHGRGFAYRASNFTMWCVFKNMLFCIPFLLFNTFTGYSGAPFYQDFSYQLFNLITIIGLFVYLYMDQDVSHHEMNEDYQLPYSLSKLYAYRHEGHLDQKLKRYVYWYQYCWYASIILFFVPFASLNGVYLPASLTGNAEGHIFGGVINNNGMTGDLFTSGYASFAILINIYHIILLLGTRHFSGHIVASYVFSYVLYFAVTLIDDLVPSTETYNDGLQMSAGSLITFLSVLLGTSMIGFPLYFAKAWEMNIRAPWFYQKDREYN